MIPCEEILNFTIKFEDMNQLFYDLAHTVEWSFETFLEPLGNSFNYCVIVLGFIGLFLWLNLQKKYTKKAKKNGTIV